MDNKSAKTKLIKNILIGVAILAVYFWWLIGSGSFKEITNDFLIITQEKVLTKGKVTYAEVFGYEVQINNIFDVVEGYAYTYSFLSSNGHRIVSQSEMYGGLPLGKNIKDIPYEVEIEYLPNTPKINRIKTLSNNETDIWDWLIYKVPLALIMLLFCFIISYRLIKGGIEDYKKSQKLSENTIDWKKPYKDLTPNQQAAIQAYKKVKEKKEHLKKS